MSNIVKLIDARNLSKKHCPHAIQVDLKYATEDNFIGKPLPGYDPLAKDLCLLTPKAARALCEVQTQVNKLGLSLLVFDAYRPLRTVKYFTEWFSQPVKDEIERQRKAIHYPHIEKTDLPKLGYVAANVSRHCFGYAVDLTLVNLADQQELDMGAIFDFFDSVSRADATEQTLGETVYQNRNYLSKVMQQHGFVPYIEEFWHFDYQEHEATEPFDIPITISLKNKLND